MSLSISLPIKARILGTSLVVQWLRLCTSNAGDTALIPGWGTKIPHATAKRFFKSQRPCLGPKASDSLFFLHLPSLWPYFSLLLTASHTSLLAFFSWKLQACSCPRAFALAKTFCQDFFLISTRLALSHLSSLCWNVPFSTGFPWPSPPALSGPLLDLLANRHLPPSYRPQSLFISFFFSPSLEWRWSLMVQWLRFHAPNAGGPGVTTKNPATKILCVATKTWCSWINIQRLPWWLRW